MSKAKRPVLVGAWKTVELRALHTVEAQLKREPFDGILAKNVAAFYPCPKNLPGAKFKNNELISLVEEMSR